MWDKFRSLFGKKEQKTPDEHMEGNGKNGDKKPRAVKSILRELERVAPNAIRVEDLSRICDIPMSQLRTIFSRYNRYFDHVEKIDDGDSIQYRLDLKEKYGIKEKSEPKKKFFFKGKPPLKRPFLRGK
jgi:hypothetical protein